MDLGAGDGVHSFALKVAVRPVKECLEPDARVIREGLIDCWHVLDHHACWLTAFPYKDQGDPECYTAQRR